MTKGEEEVGCCRQAEGKQLAFESAAHAEGEKSLLQKCLDVCHVGRKGSSRTTQPYIPESLLEERWVLDRKESKAAPTTSEPRQDFGPWLLAMCPMTYDPMAPTTLTDNCCHEVLF